MAAAGTPIQQEAVTPSPGGQLAANVLDTSRRYGSHLLFRNLANNIGLLDTLREAFPKTFREIFALACFLVETQEPLAYFEEWLSQIEVLSLTPRLSSQRISNLLASITQCQRDSFYESWVEHTSEDQYVAMDITSISSYSQLIQGSNGATTATARTCRRLVSARSLAKLSVCQSIKPAIMAA